MEEMKERVGSLEKRMYAVERSAAVANAHHGNVEKRLSNIESILNKLVWLILSALIAGVMGFIVSGGIAGL